MKAHEGRILVVLVDKDPEYTQKCAERVSLHPEIDFLPANDVSVLGEIYSENSDRIDSVVIGDLSEEEFQGALDLVRRIREVSDENPVIMSNSSDRKHNASLISEGADWHAARGKIKPRYMGKVVSFVHRQFSGA